MHALLLFRMSPLLTAVLLVLVFLVSLLYSAVGHAGASGDIAAMGLVGVATASMKPIALVLNLFVATIGTFRFYRAGYFSWRLFLPFTLASVPCAYIGGRITLPTHVYRPLVGVLLLYAAYRLVASTLRSAPTEAPNPVPLYAAILWGSATGLLSGLTGVGGGIFLSPVLILMNWATTRETAGVSVAFILANSIAGLAGNLTAVHHLPPLVWTLVPAAVIGGLIGSSLGSTRFNPSVIRRLLSAALVIAGFKMIFV